MESIFIYCDYLLDMKGGEPFIKKNRCLKIKGSQIQKIYPWDLEAKDLKEGLSGGTLHSKLGHKTKKGKEKKIYLKNHLIMPGLINSHTHLPMSLFRGFRDDLPFHQWLFNCILPVEKKMLNPYFVKVGTELSALECIDKGITTTFDMYSYSESIAQVFEEYGLRGFFGEDINNTRLKIWPKLMDSLCERYLNHERIRPALAPHAPYTCEDDLLREVLKYHKKKDIPILIHVSETKKEFNDSFKKYGLSPVERLHRLGLTGKQSLFVHAVWLNEKDIDFLKRTKTSVCYNPESNMKLGSGIAPIHKLLEEEVNVCLGTDGAASNNDLNLLTEMDVGLKLQKLRADGSEPIQLGAKDMLKMVTWGGALALNMEREIGSLEEGKLADLIAIDLNDPSFYPIGDIFSNLVFSSGRVRINLVMCHGKILSYKQERPVGRDQEMIFKEVEELREKMDSQVLE